MLQKSKNNKYNSIEGKILVASPNMSDPRFTKTVIYMISDDIEGSMGIIVNKPAFNLDITKIFNNKHTTLRKSARFFNFTSLWTIRY